MKHTWFQEKTQEVEMAIHGVWRGLRAMQRGRAGLQPVRSKVIRDCSEDMCMGADNNYSSPLAWALWDHPEYPYTPKSYL